MAFLQQWVAPERFGFEKLDSINYYTSKLIELNKKVGAVGRILSSFFFLFPSFFFFLLSFVLKYSFSSSFSCYRCIYLFLPSFLPSIFLTSSTSVSLSHFTFFQTKEMQEQCFEVSRTTNADVQRKLKNKYDTRAAAAVENITKQGTH